MADTKISALTALAAADVDTAADVMAIVDTGATATKKITVDNLRTAMGPKLETEQESTSGTAIDFTSLPSWAKKITVSFVGVSTSGTANYLIQLGDSGGVEATGYLGNSTNGSSGLSSSLYTTGFGINGPGAAGVLHGTLTMVLVVSSSNTWAASGVFGTSNAANFFVTAGSKALSATLDRVRITTSNGSDTFDAGTINLLVE